MDFMLDKYRDLCAASASSSRECLTVAEYLASGSSNRSRRTLILRHDVDRFPKQALETARIESEYGLRATYYFRVPGTLVPELIREIAGMGHEVGLHYESVDKARGEMAEAVSSFEGDLGRLRAVVPVSTVAMHGNPATPFDNRDLWNSCGLEDYQLTGEAYLSIDFGSVLYYSDTGRNWLEDVFNIKDTIPVPVEKKPDRPVCDHTDDIIDVVRDHESDIYILTHPERWRSTTIEWALSAMADTAVNYIKICFQILNRRRNHTPDVVA